MISGERIRTLARRDGVTAGLAEKNYVNSWVLYAIYTVDVGDDLVFKGGTALSKLYFPDVWRLSEDLDFTARDRDLVPADIEDALQAIEATSGIQFGVANFHRAGDPVEYLQVDIQYDAILAQGNRTRLDITTNEELAFDTVSHDHSFEDVPPFVVEAYALEEILVEKVRSLFQRARARDYYDLYQLLDRGAFVDDGIVTALREKANQQGVDVDLAGGIPEDDRTDVRDYWEGGLDRLVTDPPAFDEVLERIDDFLRALADIEEFTTQ